MAYARHVLQTAQFVTILKTTVLCVILTVTTHLNSIITSITLVFWELIVQMAHILILSQWLKHVFLALLHQKAVCHVSIQLIAQNVTIHNNIIYFQPILQLSVF